MMDVEKRALEFLTQSLLTKTNKKEAVFFYKLILNINKNVESEVK
jgi:hypothetical protein